MTSTLKVAHLVQGFVNGGIEKLVERLGVNLRGRGLDFAVAAYRADGPMRAALQGQGVSAVLFPGRDGLDPVLPLRIARWLRAEKADIVHTHHFGPFVYGAAAAKLLGLPVIHTEHSHAVYDTPRRLALGRRMDDLAKVVAVSEEVASWRASTLGRRCQVVLNGVQVQALPTEAERARARAACGAKEDDLVVGCVARLVPGKDHLSLLRAAAVARKHLPNLRIVLIGDGPERRRVEAETRHLGLDAQVKLLGDRADVARLLPGLDVFSLVSRHEGLPLALLEAMAIGLPSVATEVGEMPRILAGGAGRLVPAGDPLALADALVRVGHDPDWRARAGRVARATVETRYSIDAMARAYLGLYCDAVSGRRAA